MRRGRRRGREEGREGGKGREKGKGGGEREEEEGGEREREREGEGEGEGGDTCIFLSLVMNFSVFVLLSMSGEVRGTWERREKVMREREGERDKGKVWREREEKRERRGRRGKKREKKKRERRGTYRDLPCQLNELISLRDPLSVYLVLI